MCVTEKKTGNEKMPKTKYKKKWADFLTMIVTFLYKSGSVLFNNDRTILSLSFVESTAVLAEKEKIRIHQQTSKIQGRIFFILSFIINTSCCFSLLSFYCFVSQF